MPCTRPLSPLDNILPLLLPPLELEYALPHLPLPPLIIHTHPAPPSPSDTCSSTSSPPPDTIRVVCNVPLLAPRPLPYHSPTFLQFDLPDTDEDLSHPPYTHRPSKRKRSDGDDNPKVPQSQPKRRPGIHRPSLRSHLVHRLPDRPSPHISHRSGNHRSRT